MIFVDTGALLARFVARDQHHTRAQRRLEATPQKRVAELHQQLRAERDVYALGAADDLRLRCRAGAQPSWYLGHSRSCVRTLPMS